MTEAQGIAHLASSAVVQGSLTLARVCDTVFGPMDAQCVIAASMAAVERFRSGDTFGDHELLIMMSTVSGAAYQQLIANAADAKNAAIKARVAGKHADADAYMRDAESMTRQAGEVARVVNLTISRRQKISKGTGGGRFHLIDDRASVLS